MKDFSQVLTNNEGSGKVAPRKEETLSPKDFDQMMLRDRILKGLSPVVLSLITSPMAVASAYLQMAQKTATNPIDQKLVAQRDRNLPVNRRFIQNGLYGDNRPYQPATLKGYSQAFQQLAQQGLLGFYKGNFTHLVMTFLNSSARTAMVGLLVGQRFDDNVTNVLTILMCSLVDVVTSPLMTIQSRLILQNRTPNFRTYNSPIDMLKKVPVKQLFSGWAVHFPKNLAMVFSWFNIIKESPMNSFVLSTSLAHLTTYPFTTVLRRMQVQSDHPQMLNTQHKNSWHCLRDILTNEGIRGFYRGFGAYCVVHGFTIALMVQINLRSGFFTPF